MEPAAGNGPDGSTVFTDEEGYERQIPKKWTFDNCFEFETEELRKIYTEFDPTNTVATDVMKEFLPTETTLQYGNMKPQRLIFYPLNGADDFSAEEKTALKAFKDFCKGKGVPVPETDNEILRFLTRTQLDVQKAYDGIVGRTKLENEMMPLKFNQKVHDIVQSGFVYIGGRDRMYRPVMVVRAARLLALSPTPQEAIAAMYLQFTYMEKYMMVPGRIENLVTINSQEEFSIFKMQPSLMKGIIPALQGMQAGRARGMYIVNAISAFSMIFKVVSMFLSETTLAKVQVTSNPNHPDLLKLVSLDQLEARYGGKVPDRKDGEYWPPRLPNDSFDAENAVTMTSVAGGNAASV